MIVVLDDDYLQNALLYFLPSDAVPFLLVALPQVANIVAVNNPNFSTLVSNVSIFSLSSTASTT
jgi:hypothetical protein